MSGPAADRSAAPALPCGRGSRLRQLLPQGLLLAGAAVVLAGPTALAFLSGGYLDKPRLAAGVAAWLLVALSALLGAPVLPRRAASRLALCGLALLAAWTGASLAWAPFSLKALDDFQRLLLYLGALVAAFALLRGSRARYAEPALAAGALVIVLYGLSERLLPGLFDLERSASAEGRLEQPLTYWNAMGGLAAIGMILAAGLAGDLRRAAGLRAAAAAGTVPLALGVYLSFSRGALIALAVGTVALLAMSPTRAQVRAVAVAVGAVVVAVGAATAFPAVRGGERAFESVDGAAVLLIVVAAAAAGALLLRAAVRREAADTPRARRIPAPAAAALAGAGLLLVAAWIALAVSAESSPSPEPRASRLATVESKRYGYWRVALGALAQHPLEGVGAGGFRSEWLRERDRPDPAQDAHSLPLETGAELGAVGLLFLGIAFGGVAAAAVGLRRRRALAAAPTIAVLVAFAVHSGIDWLWELPALALVPIVLAGAMLGAYETLARGRSATAPNPDM